MAEKTSLIWNPILRQYLVNAPHRMNRREGATSCAFCDDITEGRVAPDTQVWLHPNDFPPFQPPVGEAYIVIYNRDHHRTFTQLTVQEVCSVTRLWRDLYIDLASRYAAIMIFENSGESILYWNANLKLFFSQIKKALVVLFVVCAQNFQRASTK